MEKHDFGGARIFETIIETVPFPIFLVDGETRIHTMNQAAEQCSEMSREQAFRQLCGKVLKCLYEKNRSRGAAQPSIAGKKKVIYGTGYGTGKMKKL